MDQKRKGFFWPSYVDLLTALFAIVLVLFVLSFKLFKDKERVLINTTDSLRILASQALRIEKIDKQIKALESKGTFFYDQTFKRFLVKDFIGQQIFDPGNFSILDKYKNSALAAGKEIRDLIKSFDKDDDISFVVLIEGNTAKKNDGTPKGTLDGNYELSYKRSLALINFWKTNGINFSNKTEIIIAGSGVYGVGRDINMEENNRRFLIQVIPKIKK